MTDFHTSLNRNHTRSVKWDGSKDLFQKDVIPLWIADMDFKAPKEVNDALIERSKHGIYGYTLIDEDVTNPIVNWISNRHDWEIDNEWLLFSPTVITSIAMAIQAFTNFEETILIQTPVYNPFFDVIKQNGRNTSTNPLIYKNGRFEIDFKDFEEKIIDRNIKAFILCSPHNPVGRVWEKEELNQITTICMKHNVLILSDEIHSDLIYSGHKHIPIASLSKEASNQTITFMSPSKTFNMPGLQASFIVTKNDIMRRKLEDNLHKVGLKQLNTMANIGIEAVYRNGEYWLTELLLQLEKNKNYVLNSLGNNIPELTVIPPEGTYLMWMDCSKLNMTTTELKRFFINEANVGLNPGSIYGIEGSQYMRLNIACPPSILKQAIQQIVEAVKRNREVYY